MMTSRAGKELRVFYIIIMIGMALGVYAAHAANEKSLRVCNRTENTKAYILTSIDRSLVTLPTISYYKEHPQELRLQLADITKTRGDFLPSPCDPGLFGLF